MTINCKRHGIVGTVVLANGNAYCPYCGFPELPTANVLKKGEV